MKQSILLILIVNLCVSFTYADDNLTIVAIGQAEKDSEKITFSLSGTSNLRADENKKLNQMIKIFKEDFSFYKSLFSLEARASEARFIVGIKVEVVEKNSLGQFSSARFKKEKRSF